MPQFNEGNINSYLVPSGSLTGSLSNSGTLTGQIAIGTGGGTSDYNDLTNKPSINSVTLSGNKTTADLNISYNDLDDKPTIPAAQVNSDWNAESGVAEILNKPTIPTELDDLSDVDTTGTFNGAVLTYIANDDKWEAFSVPQQLPPPVESLQNVIETSPEYSGQVLKLSHGSPVTKWTNDYVSYNELTDRPTIPDPQVNSDWNASSGVAEILNKPTLATVATSGSYNDLTDQPTIPDLTTTNISNEYTFTKNSGSWEIQSFAIYKTGNTYQAQFTLKGDGTAVAAGSDGCVYSMSTGTTPLLFSFFIAMVGTSFCLGFFNSGDSTWHFRPINAAVTLNANSRLNFSGLFIK